MNARFDPQKNFAICFSHDQRLNRIAIVIFTLISTLLILGSLLIWPYILSLIHIDPQRYKDAGTIISTGRTLLWLGLGTSLIQLIIGAVIFWFSDSELYSVIRTGLSLFIVGFVLYAAGANVFHVDYVKVTAYGGAGIAFSFIVNIFMAFMLALLPTAIVTFLSHLARTLFNAWFRHVKRNR